MTAELSLNDVSVGLADQDRKFTLDVPELSLASGEVIGLTGASGTGKTLLLEVLGMLRRPSRAGRFEITSDTEAFDLVGAWSNPKMSPPDIRGAMFGFVPQSGGLLPFLNVAENVALPQKIAGVADVKWCDALLERLGISDIRNLYPGALSIGQRQRVAICRALSHRPAFVIADEPTAALDPEAAERAMGLLIDTAATGGAGVIISSHDLTLLDHFDMRRVSLGLVNEAGANEVRSELSGQVHANSTEHSEVMA